MGYGERDPLSTFFPDRSPNSWGETALTAGVRRCISRFTQVWNKNATAVFLRNRTREHEPSLVTWLPDAYGESVTSEIRFGALSSGHG